MQIERLVTMANQIGDYFNAEPDKREAAVSVASHLKRFWDPRMRKQIIEHYQARGEGFSDLARTAVGILAEQAAAVLPTVKA